MHLRVIEGGLSRPTAIAERPIVWNRMPRETCLGGQRRALVLRGAGDLITLAVDDHREYLVGIRDVDAGRNPTALQAWLDWAKGEGMDLRDERTV